MRQLYLLRRKFPTGALTTLSVDCGWEALGDGTAALVVSVRPKPLPRSAQE